MRLKKLIVQGFKSFADRTEFVFDAPITGVVGPNGCGKSNVVDAIKWVLGEQSAKSLRGEAMMDVIFNGAAGRKAGGMAEVTLVFDNPRREDESRLLNIDADEVAVGRRLYRDGTSQYTVNNSAARLRDIRELFLDTGVGVDAYSVIEQGKVDLLLQSNPQERRLIFEEAAGISKYKAKKKEAQRKLEKVDQNLLRLNDIVEEVEKRLRSVKVQAGRARTYQEHSQRLRELRLTYAIQEYHTHHQQHARLTAEKEDAQFRLDDLAGDLTHTQSALGTQREEFEALSQRRQKSEYDLVAANAAVQSARQQQDYARQQLAQIDEQAEGFAREREAGGQKLAELASALEAESARLSELTAQLEEQRRLIDQRQQAFKDGQLQLNTLNREVEGHKSAILEIMRALASINSRLGAIDIEQRNNESQKTRLGQRQQVVVDELAALATNRQELQAKLDAVLEQIAEQQQQSESAKQEAAALGKQMAQLSEQLGAAREHRSGLLSRQKLLKDLEARREGVSEGVKSILRQRNQRFSFIRGLVADVLRVDVDHAHAIEAALDGRDQLLITHDSAGAFAARESFENLEGRVSVLCADRLPAFNNGYDWNVHAVPVRLAVDLVRVEPEDRPIAEHLLGHTVVVDDLDGAAALHRDGPAGYRYVTLAGEVIEADGTLRAGPLTAAMGLLSRRSELEALDGQISEVDGRIARLSEELAQGSAQARSIEQRLNDLRNAGYQSNTAKVELTSQIARTTDKQNALERERPVLERELATLADHYQRLETEKSALAQKAQERESEQSQRQAQIEAMGTRQQELAEELRLCGDALTTARVQAGQAQEKQLACQQQVGRMNAQQAELRQQIERLERSAEALVSRRQSVQREFEAARQHESTAAEQVKELTARVEDLSAQVARMSAALKQIEVDVESIRGRHAAVEQELHTLDVQCGEARVRLETLINRTREELELDLPARYAELSAGEGGYQPGETDWNTVAEEIRQLKEKIGRLGNVNLEAINEQQELEQRQQFLATQVADLTGSKKQLEEMIETINQESSLRFEQTFAAVREHFQGMFRKLFGGGKADIFLQTESDEPAGVGPDGQPLPARKIDILDAGIEIIAKPPGKQPCSISQLSGGEKTMTCVALLMSIFKSKPSPFCILDEVDAALDEANNQRFNLIVQEFLEQSQFIIITHSKRTMQIADVLYGVTMQEQGVSKRVAVRFEQVDAQGRIAEQAAA